MRGAAALLLGAAVAVALGLGRGSLDGLGRLSPPTTGRPGWRDRLGAVVACLVVAVWLLGPSAAAVLAAAGVAAGWLVKRRRRAVSVREERRGALEACGVFAGELRAGTVPAEALAAAGQVATGPARDRLLAAASVGRLGGDVAASLAAPVPGSAVPEVLAGLAVCWRVCTVSGSGLAAGIERLEDGLRAQAELGRVVDAELAGPRASAALLALLPFAGLLLAAGLGADPLRVLLHTVLGGACLVAGLALDLLGVHWTGRLARRAGG